MPDSSHEEFCTATYPELISTTICGPCQLIRRVRKHDADNYPKSLAEIFNTGYRKGREHASQAVYEIPYTVMHDAEFVLRDEAIQAANRIDND